MTFFKAHIINPLTLGILGILILAQFFISIPFYFHLLLGLVWFAITSLGSFNILLNYHIEALNFQANPAGKQIALTFDDGPHPTNTLAILSLLKKYNAKATFFCIGRQIELHPQILVKIIEEGHSIGNHTYSHSNNFGFFNAEKVAEELKWTDELVEKITGHNLRLFRPPFGVTNPNIKKALQKSGHVTIGWCNRSLDTVLKPKEKVMHRVLSRLKSGDIVLLHDTIPQTIDVVEEILVFLQKNKYEAVSVDTLLKIKAYA